MIRFFAAIVGSLLILAPGVSAQTQRATTLRTATQSNALDSLAEASREFMVCGISRRPSSRDRCVSLRALSRANEASALDIAQEVRDLVGNDPNRLERLLDDVQRGGRDMGCSIPGARSSSEDVLAVLTSFNAAADVLNSDWSSSFENCRASGRRGGGNSPRPSILADVMTDVLNRAGPQSIFEESFAAAMGQCMDEALGPDWRSQTGPGSMMDGATGASQNADNEITLTFRDGTSRTYRVGEEVDGQIPLTDVETGQVSYACSDCADRDSAPDLLVQLVAALTPSSSGGDQPDERYVPGPVPAIDTFRPMETATEYSGRPRRGLHVTLGQLWARVTNKFGGGSPLDQEGNAVTGGRGDCLDPDTCATAATCRGEAQAEALRQMFRDADYDGCGAEAMPTPDGHYACPRSRRDRMSPELHAAMAAHVCAQFEKVASGTAREGFRCMDASSIRRPDQASNICDNPAAYCSDEQDIAFTVERNGSHIGTGGIGPLPMGMGPTGR